MTNRAYSLFRGRFSVHWDFPTAHRPRDLARDQGALRLRRRLPGLLSEVISDVREEHVEIARSLQPRFVSLMLPAVAHARALAEFCFNQLRLLSATLTPTPLPSPA